MMRNFLKILLLLLLGNCGLSAQTVIELKSGHIRGKTIDDYCLERGAADRAQKDSLNYIDRLRRAFNALHIDSLDMAENLFEEALKIRPTAPGNYVVRYNLGRICLARGKYRDAIRCFDEALREYPALADARYDRAVCFYEMGNLSAACTDCETLLATGSDTRDEVQTLFLLTAVHRKMRQFNLARADLERILTLSPENVSADLLLAGTLEDLGQPRKALERLNLFVAAHPKNVDGFVARAGLLFRLALPDAATIDYDAAIRLQPDNGMLYVSRARVALATGEKDTAMHYLRQAVAHGIPRGELVPLFRQAAK